MTLADSIKQLTLPDVSDTEIILSSVSLLDDHLENLLHASLLGKPEDISFITHSSAQMRILARGIGLLSETEAHDYKVLGKIRNVVAHSAYPMRFEDDRVSGSLGRLSHFDEWRERGMDLRSIHVKSVYCLARALNTRLAAVKRIRREVAHG